MINTCLILLKLLLPDKLAVLSSRMNKLFAVELSRIPIYVLAYLIAIYNKLWSVGGKIHV